MIAIFAITSAVPAYIGLPGGEGVTFPPLFTIYLAPYILFSLTLVYVPEKKKTTGPQEKEKIKVENKTVHY
jgi:hypothetical protein